MLDTSECPHCLDTVSVEFLFTQYQQDGTAEAKLKCHGCGHVWFMHYNGTRWHPRKG